MLKETKRRYLFFPEKPHYFKEPFRKIIYRGIKGIFRITNESLKNEKITVKVLISGTLKNLRLKIKNEQLYTNL